MGHHPRRAGDFVYEIPRGRRLGRRQDLARNASSTFLGARALLAADGDCGRRDIAQQAMVTWLSR